MNKKIKLIGGALAISASMALGAVTVNFSNSIPPGTDGDNDIPQSLILSFSVDGTGKVTLDASAPGASPTVSSAVNAWDGLVGTISYAGAFNTTFTLDLSGGKKGKLKLSNFMVPGGLGLSGQNAFRIDNNGREAIAARAAIPAGQINFLAISWNSVQNKATCMLATGPSGTASGRLVGEAGSWDVSAENFRVGDGQELIFSTPVPGEKNAGYTLGGFTFDVVAESGSGSKPIVVGCL